MGARRGKHLGGFAETPIEYPRVELDTARRRYEHEFPPSPPSPNEDGRARLERKYGVEFQQEFRAACERSLYVFAKFVLQMLDLKAELHGRVCDWLQDMSPRVEHAITPHLTVKGGRRKLLMLPVVHLKTSVGFHAFPLHVLIQPQQTGIYFPDMAGQDCRILSHGESVDKASENLSFIAQHLQYNKLLRYLWPHICWNNRKEAPVWTARC
jgi:hypothetical protein